MSSLRIAESDDWVKLYEQTPPVNEDVEVKVLVNGEERIYINQLTPLMNGKYVWMYCDYDDGDEVVAWRRLAPHSLKLLNYLNEEEFIERYCSKCGSQRCEGIGTEWFDGCRFREHYIGRWHKI